MTGEMPEGVPIKSDFHGSVLNKHDFRWDFGKQAQGIRKKSHWVEVAYFMPEDEVLVAWKSDETSCISCKDQSYTVRKREKRGLSLPSGIFVTGYITTTPQEGASWTGNIDLESVPEAEWKKVYVEKYL